MRNLIREYELTLKETRKRIKEIEKEIHPFKQIYEDKSIHKDKRSEARAQAEPLRQEKSLWSSMETDLVFALTWMKTGRQPGTLRGIERRAAYERELCTDPAMMESLYACESSSVWETEEESVRSVEESLLDEALSVLTEKEREVYWMYAGSGQSQYEIAKQLFVSRSTVQTMIHRANKKLESFVANRKEGVN